ncbi:hypothetical protein CVT24_006466 [Panaeolus cyanescens]|uniref:Amidase domain-containing protein n=1 Tax=Panaeolus cyanescens TaxID=181874 RepID=A0A409VZ08_9AGAR|nr:hypothetical protein CVT24_006466 [Panaeolus cyanescens]
MLCHLDLPGSPPGSERMETNSTSPQYPDLYEASILELQAGLEMGHFTSVDLVEAYFRRIEEVNQNGPCLRAVIETNPSARRQAESLDQERKRSGKRGFLHGMLKDNMATIFPEGMNTTCGSYTLLGSVVPDDAGIVKKLREAGAIILGKSNLSEFSHARGTLATGWSGRGGQCTNAYCHGGDPAGSSSGSAVAVSIGLAPVALGTETDGSIVFPASFNNIVGVKPTVGLTSRAGVIPITLHQDTIGPLTRTVLDSAIVLNAIAGVDANDKDTLSQPTPLPDYVKAMRRDALKGKRIGVPRHYFSDGSNTEADPFVNVAFNEALDVIRKLGAVVVDPADIPSADKVPLMKKNENHIWAVDMKITLESWFKTLKSNPTGVHNIDEIIKFNDDHPELEKPEGFENQDNLIVASKTNGHDEEYHEGLKVNKQLGGSEGIDSALQSHNLDALVLPASFFDTTTPSGVAGYPIVTVPMAFFPEDTKTRSSGPLTVYPAPGFPLGLSFLGTAWSEFDLLSYAFAYEQETRTRLARLAFPGAIPKTQLQDVILSRKSS